MWPIFRKVSTGTLGTQIWCRAGAVRISSRAALAAPGNRWQAFLERITRLPEIDEIDLDLRRGIAELRYSGREIAIASVLERMAQALAPPTHPGAGRVLENDSPAINLSSLAERSRIQLFRRGSRLSTWKIVHETSGRLRVRDDGLRDSPATVQRITSALRTVTGIRDVTVSTLTGSLLLDYDAATVDRDRILACLDELVAERGLIRCESLPQPSHWLSAHATLALAAAGTLIYPPLLPLSAVILVAGNLSTFANAWRQLRRRQAGLPVLHTAIVGATLASGGFLGASLMNWLLLYWQDRRARLTAAGRQVLSEAVRLPASRVWVVVDGAELEIPLSELQTGAIVAVRAGETIPSDGRIVAGNALIDEQRVHGAGGLAFRTTGDAVLHGSCLVAGELRVEVVSAGSETLATAIERTVTAAISHNSQSANHPLPEIAEQAVPPTLMTAGVGLLLGDATVAAAVLRPDYASGPGLSGSLAEIDGLGACLDQGIVVRRPDVFEQMALADTVVFDHDPNLELRLLQVESVQVAAGFTRDEIVSHAACAVRKLNDRRARAVGVAHEELGHKLPELPVTYHAGAIEFQAGDRRIRITGMTHTPDAQQSAPLIVESDGALAGSIVFAEASKYAAHSAIFDLRTECSMQVELLSSSAAASAQRLGTALGVDGVHLCASDEARARVIRNLVAAGHRVVFVGNCRKYPQAAAAAQVAVSHEFAGAQSADPCGAWLLGGRPDQLVAFRNIAVSLRDEVLANCNLILIPNMVCVAGALLLGFSSLAVVILSNIGTYTLYTQGRAALRRTERRFQNHGRRPRSEFTVQSQLSTSGRNS